jgi:hypothetical protein
VSVFGLGTDPGTGEAFARVQRFDGSGGFVSAFAVAPPSYPVAAQGAVAVDQVSGAVYLLEVESNGGARDRFRVLRYSADGVFEYELDPGAAGVSFLFFGGLAVDPVDGSVLVAATDAGGAQVVARLSGSSGALVGSFDGSLGSPDGSGFACLSGLAVDVVQRVLVAEACERRVDRYSGGGVYEQGLVLPQRDGGPETPSAVATDPSNGEVYVAHSGLLGPQVTHYAVDLVPVYTFDASVVDGVIAMAVSATGTVYLADSAEPVIARFGRFDGPTVVTGATSPPEARSVTVQGTINPEGVASEYYFEYGIGLTYGSRTTALDAGSGSSAVAVSADLVGLRPNTAYHYRLVGARPEGVIVGADMPFTTGPAPASVDPTPGFVTALGSRSAVLHGTANANSSFSASYSFEYGTTTGYGQSAVGSDFGSLCFLCGGDDIAVSAPLSGLLPATTYHFRVVADNGFGGPQFGADQTFVTAPAAGAGASGVTTRRATLTGTIDPHGGGVTYHFNYGPTSSYGASTPEVDGGAGNGERQVSQQVGGLAPDTTYHVQVVATSGGVTRYGTDGLFRTPPAPAARAIGPTAVTTSTAMLVGDVDTHGVTGSYHFELSSLDSSYTTRTAESAVAGNATSERVTTPIGGLPAGETFVVRLSVTSNDFTQVSDVVTFGTPPLPRVFPAPPQAEKGYGCSLPRLNAYNPRAKPGDTITITGADLGVGGSVVLGDRPVDAAGWSASGFKVQVPEDAAGVLGLTVDCGRRSNTIAIAVFREPDNRFAVTKVSVAGSTATLSVKVPGPGKIDTTGARIRAAKTTITRPGTAKVKVRLRAAGARALARAKTDRLRVGVRVAFTPAAGRRAAKTVTVTYKHKAGR